VPERCHEDFAQAIRTLSGSSSPPRTTAELNRAVRSLQEDLALAARAVGVKVKGRQPSKWYTPDYAKARAAFRNGVTTRRQYYAVLRKAKRKYWASLVDGATSNQKAFRLAA